MPTTQPAVGAPPIVTTLAPVAARTVASPAPYAEAVNPVLARYSAIAVEVPEPERIEVNDLVTIIIRETKSSLSDSKMKSEKDWALEAELSKWFRLDVHDQLVPQTFAGGTPGAKFDFENQYEGKGKLDRKDTLTTRVTARVVDVKPNGTLVLEAANSVEVDEEKYNVTLTGTCRSEDVTAQNSVLSTQIFGLHIDIQHTGAARDAARRGWLMRLFDLARPI
ncbi:MAG: flagellar basal body L-ring protein FlgH [Planctomycetes bacterium]|nr:flagellar basal body L-ring protein FlgH [Planctomycetota bacterium]